jgi:hypothetical protein
MRKAARLQQGKNFEVAYFRFWNESAKDSELWDLFPNARVFFADTGNFAKVALRVQHSAEWCIPRQFRLQVYLFIMVIIQGEGGGTNAN